MITIAGGRGTRENRSEEDEETQTENRAEKAATNCGETLQSKEKKA